MTEMSKPIAAEFWGPRHVLRSKKRCINLRNVSKVYHGSFDPFTSPKVQAQTKTEPSNAVEASLHPIDLQPLAGLAGYENDKRCQFKFFNGRLSQQEGAIEFLSPTFLMFCFWRQRIHSKGQGDGDAQGDSFWNCSHSQSHRDQDHVEPCLTNTLGSGHVQPPYTDKGCMLNERLGRVWVCVKMK